jgi:hypothetical protein
MFGARKPNDKLRRRPFFPGRKLEGVDVLEKPVLGFLDFEDLGGLDRLFRPVRKPQGQAALLLPVDKELFRENQAAGGHIFQEGQEAGFQVRAESFPGQGLEVADGKLKAELFKDDAP